MAVGHVDVLVGIPTLNNAQTIQRVVGAVSDAFVTYFPRERTLLLNSDGGSTDGTPALVRTVKDDAATVTVSHRLRTEHRISTPYHGLPGKGSALRQILTVAELTQARAVAVLDAEVTTLTPEWIAALIRPVRYHQFDYVAPYYSRHPADGPLISQLVRPIIRATYGWQVREPLAAEFGCSNRFLAHCLEQDVWESDLAQLWHRPLAHRRRAVGWVQLLPDAVGRAPRPAATQSARLRGSIRTGRRRDVRMSRASRLGTGCLVPPPNLSRSLAPSSTDTWTFRPLMDRGCRNRSARICGTSRKFWRHSCRRRH